MHTQERTRTHTHLFPELLRQRAPLLDEIEEGDVVGVDGGECGDPLLLDQPEQAELK